ncbi:anthocyanin 5-aromatic acyltransferase-like [Alnus glutinosa]|uniref:anthocyanin 5-aromatic acyltransferase-like n=1 Tax=Alnus glutinosa TaxID=3517 RepID=UPI002D785228|nr:anthocyanin 5-aromatic acyltransferase-like [Alnus glutinosa]
MAKSFTVKVLEHCYVSPPPSSAPQTSLPLTFFDLPWLFFSPGQPLFFYEYPFPTSYFTSTTLPNLRHSLSLTLQHYYPFAGNLLLPTEPGKPELVYTDGDKVELTFAESGGDFGHLSGNHPREVNQFHQLVPKLPNCVSGEKQLVPLLAVQITVFPNCGICIGLTYHYVSADGRTFNNFIKTWAWYCGLRDSYFPIKYLPFNDRSVIIDTHGLEQIFLKEWWSRKSSQEIVVDLSNMVRATFVMSLVDMERIKQWIIAQCRKKNQSPPIHLSPSVLVCAFIWVCLLKTQVGLNGKCFGEDPTYFGFNAGGITRLNYPVPPTYSGNCIGFARSMAEINELLEDDGIVVAAEVIGNTVKKLDKAILGGAENWISEWEVLIGSELHVLVSWSPKLDLYETDFGWGKPTKIEEISIDRTRAISMTESKDLKGGIEVGLALPKSKMDAFGTFFIEGLKLFCNPFN